VLACYQGHIAQVVPDVLFYIQVLQLKESLVSTRDEDTWMLEKSICEAFDVRFIDDLRVDVCVQFTPQVKSIADGSLVENSPYTSLLRQSCLAEYVGGSGVCIYPMFFSNELGNTYRNGRVGRCNKINFYATVYSLVRPKCRASPFLYLNVGKLVCEHLMAVPRDTERELWKLIHSVEADSLKVLTTLEAAGGKGRDQGRISLSNRRLGKPDGLVSFKIRGYRVICRLGSVGSFDEVCPQSGRSSYPGFIAVPP
jgi:hypothetical protein